MVLYYIFTNFTIKTRQIVNNISMPKFLNNILITAMIFALSFLWTYYSLKSAVWAVTLACVIALSSSYIIYRIQSKAYRFKNVKSQNKKAVADFCDFLKYNDDNATLFAELYRYYGYNVSVLDCDSLIATKDGKTSCVITMYRKDGADSFDVAEAVVQAKRRKADCVALYANKADSVALENAKRRFDVSYVDAGNVYVLFVQAGKLPAIPQIKTVKNSFVAQYAFCKKRFGWYFASSVFMALLSVIAYFPYYLLGWATVMLGLALYSLLNTRYNVKQTQIGLD